MNKKSCDFLALALDNCSQADAIAGLVRETSAHIGVYKIGLEQFTRFGPAIINEVKKAGRKIFLDLKFHDIPNTVQKAVGSAAALDVDYLTVHTQGGLGMLRAAAEGASGAENPPRIIGVTVLTSIDQQALHSELGVAAGLEQHVAHLAGLAVKAGLGGVVCSAADLPHVKPLLPASFEIITPGIRMAQNSADDQKRVATPHSAIAGGATLLVIGRPITAAEKPGEAAREFEACVSAALNQR
jgi:orotidine-5'-phosphate decarboxylase